MLAYPVRIETLYTAIVYQNTYLIGNPVAFETRGKLIIYKNNVDRRIVLVQYLYSVENRRILVPTYST